MNNVLGDFNIDLLFKGKYIFDKPDEFRQFYKEFRQFYNLIRN